MEIVPLLSDDLNVITFLLLLLRFSGVFAFFPFFDSTLIPMSVRGAIIFFMTLVCFPLAQYDLGQITVIDLMLAGLFELLFGFLAGLCLQIVFAMISFGGEIISFSMGLTMASAYDPLTGAQKPIIAQLLAILALLLALSFDFHHIVLVLIAQSLEFVPVGSFIFEPKGMAYFASALGSLFVVGFSMAFPIVAIILFSDIIFGMIMKTHPQFNLLVIGFPVKITIAFCVLIIILPSMYMHFKRELDSAFYAMKSLFAP